MSRIELSNLKAEKKSKEDPNPKITHIEILEKCSSDFKIILLGGKK